MKEVGLLLFLLSCATRHSSSIETVNVVDFCGQTIHGDGMMVNSHQESKKYYFVTMATDCHLTMQARSPKDKVQFHFRFFLVYSLLRVTPPSPAPLVPESTRGSDPLNPRLEPTSGESVGDPCHAGSFIQFYDGQDRNSPPLGPPLCGKSPPRPVLSTGNYLTLRLVTRGTQPRVDFIGDFTSFRLGFNLSECSSEPYFTCRNGKCIPLSLVCDDKGIDNCGDGSDLEENLSQGCKAGRLLHPDSPPPLATSPPTFESLPTMSIPAHLNCAVPGSPSHESADSPSSLPLVLLYVLLGVLAGGVLLCWCCWSPGWFLWRVGICRFFPCCDTTCTSCHFCIHSKEQRLAKVTPHTAALNRMPTSMAPTSNGTEVHGGAVACRAEGVVHFSQCRAAVSSSEQHVRATAVASASHMA